MPSLDDLLDKLLASMAEVEEAQRELSTAQEEYEGYSPGWALSEQIERVHVARAAFKADFVAAVREAMVPAASPDGGPR